MQNTLLTIPTGALMYGPPGTGKTLLARACAAQTDATFLKLAGPQLVQMFIGDGAKLVRDCFALAKEKAPSIIFIDELDAVGTKRFDSEKSGDREVQRTMLELLNQLDGFASDDRVKVLAATNRVDVLDPALLRSGRLDRKIEFPLPNEEARAQILRIHSRKMTVDDGVNWPELARSTDEFGGAQLKAVCVEAGMIALRLGQQKISHEHYVDAISEVQVRSTPGSNLFTFTDFPAGQKEGYCQLLRIVGQQRGLGHWLHQRATIAALVLIINRNQDTMEQINIISIRCEPLIRATTHLRPCWNEGPMRVEKC
jgi:26S proteasome regulatory subunit T5